MSLRGRGVALLASSPIESSYPPRLHRGVIFMPRGSVEVLHLSRQDGRAV